MKIYFAYRSGYIPNNRFFKVFEANSVIDWFVHNWSILSDSRNGVIEDFLGVRPYGFPISDYKTEKQVKPPANLKDLKSKLESFVYSNEVIVSGDCVKVLTDDDEIELAWFVFDENYAAKNADKVGLWFNETLPTEYENELLTETLKSKPIFPKGTENGNAYFMSSTIYDSGNLEDLEGAYRIEGVSVPNLLAYFRQNEFVSTGKDHVYAVHEIQFIQQLCRIFPEYNQQEIFEELVKYPFTEVFEAISTDNIQKLTTDSLNKIHIRRNDPLLSEVSSSKHLIEVKANSVGVFYNYTVIFDDYWLSKNRDLGKSLARFCSTWKI